MSAWSIVIPSDNVQNLKSCVAQIGKTHPGLPMAALVIVSRDLKTLPAELRGARLVEDRSAYNFARRVNLGIVQAKTDVVIMGDDVEVQTDRAFDLLASEAPLRILAPSVKGRIGPWWQKESQDHADVPFVSFTCVYLPRGVYDIVGKLEEGFPGYGYEDTDYCVRARKAGLSCGVKGSVVVQHGVGIKSDFVVRHGTDLARLEAEAAQAFYRKHSRRG